MAEPADSQDTSRKSRVLHSVQSRAQQVLLEDYGQTKSLVSDAARSGAYLYPIRGIVYLASHRTLWKPLLRCLVPYLGISASVFGAMFVFTYLPQLAVLVFVNGPMAVFSTVLLILSESSALANAIARPLLLQDALLDAFDATLLARNQGAVVRQGRELKPGSGGDPMARLGKVLRRPFAGFGLTAFVRYVLYLPLNIIPVVGTVMFVGLQGRARGRRVHDRYFQLKNWSASQKKDWLEKHTGSYTAFGLVATLLEMVPLASVVFSFTNTVGAAIWAADVEANKAATTTDGTGIEDHKERENIKKNK